MKSSIAKKNKEVLLHLLSFFLLACEANDAIAPEPARTKDRTLLLYAVADNNLRYYSDSLKNMVGCIDMVGANSNLVLYLDNGDSCNLYQRDDNSGCLRFVRTFGDRNSLDEANMKEVFNLVRKEYPAKEMGLILWSHGTGWLPTGRATRSFGDDKGEAADIHAIANSLTGLEYDYLIFDACYMGCLEVAWELRDAAKYIVTSPAEVPIRGVIGNADTIEQLLDDGDISNRLRKICNKYVDTNEMYIMGKSISVVDANKLKTVASKLRNEPVTSKTISAEQLKHYEFRGQMLFFDAKDVFGAIGRDSLFSECVVYANCDDRNESHWCGLSVFVPIDKNEAYHQNYQTLSWNESTGWMDIFGR